MRSTFHRVMAAFSRAYYRQRNASFSIYLALWDVKGNRGGKTAEPGAREHQGTDRTSISDHDLTAKKVRRREETGNGG